MADGGGTASPAGTYSCLTTRSILTAGANHGWFAEQDTIARIGAGSYGWWYHGTARPEPGDTSPFYDYYLGYVKGRWIYVQIDPFHGSYFVATPAGDRTGIGSLIGSWQIMFPAEQGTYVYSQRPNSFTIRYPDLTQVCTKLSSATPPPPLPSMHCVVHKTDGSGAPDELLSIATIAPPATPSPAAQAPPLYPWWQGVARYGTDIADPGPTVYEYNMFVIHSQRIAVIINGSNGSYAIATSRLAFNLDDTSWTVVYPEVRNGFTFTNVAPERGLPTSLTINFHDGYQACSVQGGT